MFQAPMHVAPCSNLRQQQQARLCGSHSSSSMFTSPRPTSRHCSVGISRHGIPHSLTITYSSAAVARHNHSSSTSSSTHQPAHLRRSILLAAQAAAATPAAATGDQTSGQTSAAPAHGHVVDPEAAAEAQRQSLELLEWPAVCRQVRPGCLCFTTCHVDQTSGRFC
jgi:hypothetical protein